MRSEKIHQLLKYLNARNIDEGTNWVRCSCLFAPWLHKGKDEHPSFGIRIDDAGKSIFHCFGCGKKGSLSALLTELAHLNKSGHYPMQLAEAFLLLDDEESIYPDPGEWSPFAIPKVPLMKPWPINFLKSFPKAFAYDEAMAYLRSRGLEDETIAHFDIRWDASRRAVAFPFFNRNGAFVGMRGRHIDPEAKVRFHDYRFGQSNTGLVWHNEHAVDWTKPLILVEASFDAAAVWPHYPNVVAALTVSVSNMKLSRIEEAPVILCMFDADTAGEQGFERLCRFLKHHLNVVRVLPQGAKDPSDMHPIALRNIIRTALHANALTI